MMRKVISLLGQNLHKKNKYIIVLIISIIHLIIFQIRFEIPQPKPKKIIPHKIKTVIVKEKPIKRTHGVSHELYVLPDNLSKIIKNIPTSGNTSHKKPCLAPYRGVGYAYSSNNVVTRLAKNGPAEKAGLKVGDIVMGPDRIVNVYPVGTVITLIILRKGIILEIPMKIATICSGD